MLALAQSVRRQNIALWHEEFLAMMPAIRRQARIAFRNVKKDTREEAVAEVVTNALVAFVRLVERGKGDLAYPTVLAHYAVAQIRVGRRVGSGQKKNDVLAGAWRDTPVQRLDRRAEVVIEDNRTPVPEQAAFRYDFPAWLATHSPRNRRIAELLCMGNSPSEVAERFRMSRARISQLRREFHDSWRAFHGEASSQQAALQQVAISIPLPPEWIPGDGAADFLDSRSQGRLRSPLGRKCGFVPGPRYRDFAVIRGQDFEAIVLDCAPAHCEAMDLPPIPTSNPPPCRTELSPVAPLRAAARPLRAFAAVSFFPPPRVISVRASSGSKNGPCSPSSTC